MFQKYIMDISCLKRKDLMEQGYQKISNERRQKADKVRTELSKRQAVGAGLMLREALEEQNISYEQDMIYSDNGKPKLSDSDSIWFNLSHSGERVMCVIADHPIGCDVEKIGAAREKVAKMIFTEQEWNEFERLYGTEKQAAFFYQIWTRKESLSKAFGCGMKVPFQKIEVWPDTNEDELCRIMEEYMKEEHIPETFQCKFEEFQRDEYQFCICHIEKESQGESGWE